MKRKMKLLNLIDHKVQTFITTTHFDLGYHHSLDDALVLRIGERNVEGGISKWKKKVEHYDESDIQVLGARSRKKETWYVYRDNVYKEGYIILYGK